MKLSGEVFVLFCGVFAMSRSQLCEYAPACPDLATWKAGFICDDSLMPNVKTRVIDGIVRRTICCKVSRRCDQNFWCNQSTPAEEKVTKKPQNPLSRPSCDTQCASSWRPLTPPNSPIMDGVRAGSFALGISSFVGRALINNEIQLGRVQLVPPVGLYYTLDGEVKFTNLSVEYLARNENYIWVNSSHGAKVEGAVTIAGNKNLPFYIGRVEIDSFAFVGTVINSLRLLYYSDTSGIERTSDCYEVLACQSPVDVTSIHNLDTPLNDTAASPNNANAESSISSNLVNLQRPQDANLHNSTADVSSGPVAELSGVNFADPISETIVNVTDGIGTGDSGQELTSTGIVEEGEEEEEEKESSETNGIESENLIEGVTEEVESTPEHSTQSLLTSTPSLSLTTSKTKRTRKTKTTKKVIQTTTSSVTANDETPEASESTIKPLAETPAVINEINSSSGDSTFFPPWLFTTESTTSVANDSTAASADETNDNKIDEYQCVPKWKQLALNTSFLYDGVEVSTHKSEAFSYIGRVLSLNSVTPGRIDIKPPAPLTFNRNEQQNDTEIEYLAKTHTQTYSWVKSSNGLAVKNAISMSEANEWPFLVGKVKINGKFFVGKVLPSIGLKFLDRYGNEKYTKFYEVLVCESIVSETANDEICAKN